MHHAAGCSAEGSTPRWLWASQRLDLHPVNAQQAASERARVVGLARGVRSTWGEDVRDRPPDDRTGPTVTPLLVAGRGQEQLGQAPFDPYDGIDVMREPSSASAHRAAA
jgi:hypothetical protein